jgi:hypothetical protein
MCPTVAVDVGVPAHSQTPRESALTDVALLLSVPGRGARPLDQEPDTLGDHHAQRCGCDGQSTIGRMSLLEMVNAILPYCATAMPLALLLGVWLRISFGSKLNLKFSFTWRSSNIIPDLLVRKNRLKI